MNWDFTANCPDELAKVGNGLLNAKRQAFLDEQVQMTRLLEALSTVSIFEYPVRVKHIGHGGVPDFRVASGERRIAIEFAKVTSQDAELARGLQNKGLKQTFEVTSLYRKKSKPRTVDEILKESAPNQPLRFCVSLGELNGIWIEEMMGQLTEKTKVLHGIQFEHGDEDWLVLVDRLGTDEFEIKPRVQAIKNLLAPLWKRGWFSRVLVQQIDLFPFVAIFAETGVISVLRTLEQDTPDHPPDFVFSGSPDD